MDDERAEIVAYIRKLAEKAWNAVGAHCAFEPVVTWEGDTEDEDYVRARQVWNARACILEDLANALEKGVYKKG